MSVSSSGSNRVQESKLESEGNDIDNDLDMAAYSADDGSEVDEDNYPDECMLFVDDSAPSKLVPHTIDKNMNPLLIPTVSQSVGSYLKSQEFKFPF